MIGTEKETSSRVLDLWKKRSGNESLPVIAVACSWNSLASSSRAGRRRANRDCSDNRKTNVPGRVPVNAIGGRELPTGQCLPEGPRVLSSHHRQYTLDRVAVRLA